MHATHGRPAWADALKSVFLALANQRPAPMHALLAALSGAQVSDREIVDFILNAEENDPAVTQMRMALAKWDADEDQPFLDVDGNETQARTASRRLVVYSGLGLADGVASALSVKMPVFEVPAIVISKTFEPWYAEERKIRTSVYWDDYEAYLRDTKRWPASAITSLDETTTHVIERLSKPTRVDVKQTKGLVVGYVQSGKTANFTGVVAKAIDAGYRLVIVLTGTIEILRSQTQRRLDMELVGVENILAGQDPKDPKVAKELDYQQDRDWLAEQFVHHGTSLDQPGVVHVSRVTTHHSDYKRLPQGLTRLQFFRTDKQQPLNHETNLFNSNAYVAIIKKNSAPLKKLIQDLTPLKNDLAQLPVLIIDDESDQASVDTTNPAKWNKGSAENRKRTTINGLITEILHLCPRAQYVGYTATPFANVFVDPDDARDLFPADFVLSLRRPPDYMGVQEFHDVGKRWDDEEKTVANSNELAHIRPLIGDSDTAPVGRLAELQDALDAWVIAGAIKKYRESASTRTYRHHTMLVHESVKKAEHSDTADDVRALWNTSKFNSAAGFARLGDLYQTDFLPVMEARAGGDAIPSSFDDLKPYIGAALAEMTIDGDPVLIVNSDKEVQAQQKKLDFEADKVWRILIGGTQLSRGFTVEGLTVSYFRRKAGQADTLMQAGRWFGFRPGYQDLVRLYIRRDHAVDLYEAFEALLMDEESFRDELRQYEGFDENGIPLVEPRQIPPLVSQHLPWLKPTARNKMWNAVIDSKATAGGIQDRYGLPTRGSGGNRSNLVDVGIPLLVNATNLVSLDYELSDESTGKVPAKVGCVTADRFMELFGKLTWHPEYDVVIAPFKRFLNRATTEGTITEWAVVWPQPTNSPNAIDVPELGGLVPVVKRNRRVDRIDFVGSDRKHSSAAVPIAKAEPVSGLAGARGRGAVLIYLADDRENPETPLSLDNVVLLLSIAAPSSATPHKRDLVQWVVRSQAQPDEAAVEITPA
jgi:Z1 domain